MGLLKAVRIRNFKCFRGAVTVEFGQATYLVGPNNSGKTAVLEAVRCFFDTKAFSPDFINKTELAAKKEGFNRSEVTITFATDQVTGKTRPKRVRETYGPELAITKSFTWREASGILHVEYIIDGKSYAPDSLPGDVLDILKSVNVSYLHPQEGAALLAQAQEKFKQRLFHNWGRHASVAERVRALQETWKDLRATANSYLSSALTTRLREIWPAAEVKVDLPERIQDVVAVSDITFRSSPNLPQISLPNHGTGAQSTILYQTHYILDSDRSLHPGMYFPVWLLEEPESFLHADIAFQLAQHLSSAEWLGSIQMLISTHSPIILAGSRQAPNRARWVHFDQHEIAWQKDVPDVTPADVSAIAAMMGDANFPVYFEVTAPGPRVFVEDSRPAVAQKLAEIGVTVTKQLRGVTEVRRYLEVLSAIDASVHGLSYFIADADAGKQELEAIIRASSEVAQVDGWRKLRISEKCFLILLPEGLAFEDLFEEWRQVIADVRGDLIESGGLRDYIPTRLSRVVNALRKTDLGNAEAVDEVLSKHQDVKDRFWDRAESFSISPRHASALRRLLDLGPE